MVDAICACSVAQRGAGKLVRGMVSLALMLCAGAGFSTVPVHARILFAADTAVPRPVQEFAWQVIETRCNYPPYERERRSFWAYDARAARTAAGIVYSIKVLSELIAKRTEPPAIIEMTVVDDGHMRLTALKASFVVCAP
jgi:hypothetical protein